MNVTLFQKDNCVCTTMLGSDSWWELTHSLEGIHTGTYSALKKILEELIVASFIISLYYYIGKI